VSNNKQTDFEVELERIDAAIAGLSKTALSLPINSEKATSFVYLLYQRASLRGLLSDFDLVESVLDETIQHLGPAGDLYLLKANLGFKFHRLGDVRRALETGRDLLASPQGRALVADLDFQEGRYDDARRGYEALMRDNLSWDNLARLAYLKWKLGDTDAAEQLYLEAEDELTAKEMRHYAWVELQRGVLDLRQGKFAETLAHYQQAERAYSGYWLVTEHKAELLGAQGNYRDAALLYEQIVATVPKPEFQQALCELYLLLDQREKAQYWQEKALAAYLESAKQGHVHYYHHLTDFFADVVEDGAEAVKWARKDIQLRDNFSTQSALAWALYRAGEFGEAVNRVNEALSSGVSEAHTFFQAGMIHRAAGNTTKAENYLHKAREINPHHESFHVHR
jgi:tetratricopeptide (TPR) repeat protein